MKSKSSAKKARGAKLASQLRVSLQRLLTFEWTTQTALRQANDASIDGPLGTFISIAATFADELIRSNRSKVLLEASARFIELTSRGSKFQRWRRKTLARLSSKDCRIYVRGGPAGLPRSI